MDDLFVMPEYRGQGVAQKLIGTIKQYAIHNNIDTIRWITAKDNIKAINVYNKLGFTAYPAQTGNDILTGLKPRDSQDISL